MFDSTADDPLAGIHDHLGQLAGEDRSGWSGGARSDRVVELLRAAERLQAEVLRAIGEWDRTQAWSADGALSPVAWLADRAPVTGTVDGAPRPLVPVGPRARPAPLRAVDRPESRPRTWT